MNVYPVMRCICEEHIAAVLYGYLKVKKLMSPVMLCVVDIMNLRNCFHCGCLCLSPKKHEYFHVSVYVCYNS